MLLPQWTEKYSRAEGGRDHLAYEVVGIRMLERLLPGISNITKRARYYSFYPWVLYRFFNSPLPKTAKVFRRFLKTKAIAFLFANGLIHEQEENTGIDGITMVRKALEKGVKTEYSWSETDIKAFPDNYWIYSAKISQLGLTVDNDDYEIKSLSSPRGKEIAEAFQAAIEGTKYFKEYCDKEDLKIPVAVLKEYGKAGDILRLQEFPAEQSLLLEAFFRFEDAALETEEFPVYYSSQIADGSARARRESLLMYLEIIGQVKGDFDRDVLRRIQYFSKVQGSLYKPNPKLVHNLEYWRMYQGRQYFVYAVEAIFRAVTLLVDEQPLPQDLLAKGLLDHTNFNALEKDLGIKVNAETTLKALLSKLAGGKTGEAFDKSRTLESKLNEETVFQVISEWEDAGDYTRLVIYPVILLGLIYLRLNYYRQNKLPYWEFGKMGEEASFSMDHLFIFIESCVSSGATIEEFLLRLVKERIVAQHSLVAIAKLSWYQNDTFHFSYEDGLLRGMRHAEPIMNSPKFDNVLNVLGDLGLIEYVGDKYRLTPSGQQTLSRI